MNISRAIQIASISAAAGLALAACGSGSSTTSGESTIDCASGSIKASGSSAQKNAITEWINAYQTQCPDATIDYQSNGSGAGIQDFIKGQTAFAGTDSAAEGEDLTAADKRCATGPAINLPMVGGAVVAAYNVDGVDNLALSPEALAGIFANKITEWNDPAIAQSNPGVTLPAAKIVQFHRSDSSGTTANFTDYLKDVAPSAWTFEAGKEWDAPGGQGAKGNEGVSSAVQSTKNSIGYTELSFALDQKLKTAQLATKAGNVSPSPEAASNAISQAEVVGTGNDVSLKLDYKATGADVYPIVLVTYELTCESGLPEAQMGLTKSFLTYTTTADAQGMLTEVGYVPMPQNVLEKVQTSVKAIS